MRYLPLSDDDRSQMLAAVGADAIDDLFVDIPEGARLDGFSKNLLDPGNLGGIGGALQGIAVPDQRVESWFKPVTPSSGP